MNATITYHDYGDHWEAWIHGGWWIGRGKTQKEAHKSVIARFNSESEKLLGKTFDFVDTSQGVQLESL